MFVVIVAFTCKRRYQNIVFTQGVIFSPSVFYFAKSGFLVKGQSTEFVTYIYFHVLYICKDLRGVFNAVCLFNAY